MRLHAIRSYAELKTELLTAVNYALKNIERDELEQARIYLGQDSTNIVYNAKTSQQSYSRYLQGRRT